MMMMVVRMYNKQEQKLHNQPFDEALELSAELSPVAGDSSVKVR